LLAVLTVGIFVGCGTISNAHDAKDDKKAVPGERTPSANEIGLPTVGPVTLDQLVDAALSVNPAILNARRTAEADEAQVGVVEGAFWPQIASGLGQDGYKYETTNVAGSKSVETAHSFYSGGFTISWLLFDFGHTPALVRQAANAWLSAQRALRLAEVTTAYSVRNAYFNLVKEYQLLKVAEDTVADDQAHLDQTHEFVLAHTKVPYDETNAEYTLYSAQLTLIKTRDALDIAQAQLANAVGIAEVTSWTPSDAAPLPPFTLTFDEAWEEAHKRQPSILAAVATQEAAKDFVDAQVASLYPSISATAGYTGSGLTFPLTWNWSFGPNVSWVLFNGFTNYYNIDEAVANLKVARAGVAAAEQTVWLNLRTAWISLRDAEESIEAATKELQYGEETKNYAWQRYRVGIATAVDVADAEAQLSQAKSDLVSARANYNVAIANCWQALGVVIWTR
jgi:outer membrane protein